MSISALTLLGSVTEVIAQEVENTTLKIQSAHQVQTQGPTLSGITPLPRQAVHFTSDPFHHLRL